ncbi:XRE family transcriptional regulator [Polymorphum gilvum]|uniref:Probable transcriptional regulator n=1 Tax=Polymorphum gilvum (strain LMG 25793 / CGMCC 1.9160 / SL003B-26A1) TaxID=991905 RepID=F2J5J2_POLGS|nr:XRE family transcriptional regulator [Polymorphum gilvum]ADZ72362.1 Probable transcriptional regulator [Polymorphum gilvum SL003B-26A1]
MAKKLFAGHVLRKIRERAGLSQVGFATRLGLSPSYVNQLESNVRPVSAGVLIAVSREFGADLASFEASDLDRLVADLGEAFADSRFHDGSVGLQDLKSVATHTPDFARAFLDLYGALRRMSEQQASLDDVLETQGGHPGRPQRLTPPYEEVRDHFHYIDNYVDDLDESAERLASELGLAWHADRLRVLSGWLADRHGVTVDVVERGSADAPIVAFDRRRKLVVLDRALPRPSLDFLLAGVVGDLTAEDLMAAHAERAGFTSPAARDICRLALRNYYAGALLLPYRRFLSLAKDYRHDLDRLAVTTGASVEQIGHRLSTLQRSGEKGVPFYFLKVDRAGNVIKRHSATRFQFARYGGSCPVWNVHEAFEHLDNRLSVQVGEMPDGTQYLCLARSVSKPASGFGARERRYALGLGCELKYADLIVYADGLSAADKSRPARIGINCRICPRGDCLDRAFPALDKELLVDQSARGVVPFSMR